MKTEIIITAYIVIIGLALVLLLQTQTASNFFWGEILTPDGEQQVFLYQKDRTLHQTPEILLYSQQKNKTSTRYLGCIHLPEDNRSSIQYTYEWIDDQQLVLLLECDYCMVEQRRYKIALAASTPDCIIPLF